MARFRFCTFEWFEALEQVYASQPAYEARFAALSILICYRVRADPDWGMGEDILFGNDFDAGKLVKLGFYSEEEAAERATFVLAASPQEWKRLLLKEGKFVSDFMLGAIELEQGTRVGVLKLASLSEPLVDFLTTHEIQFPDEMSADELSAYRSRLETCLR